MNFAERAASLLVPKQFSEFLPYVSPSALRVVHKDRVLAISLEIVARTFNRAELTADFIEVQKSISDSKLLVDVIPAILHPISAISDSDRLVAASRILELYFHLIHGQVSLPLDLRPAQFGWNPKTKRLEWVPSRLRHVRTPDFRSRVISLYRGFFNDEPSANQSGLELYRWQSSPDESYDERMEALLRQHFGDARSKPVHFNISHFKRTFHLIFEEAIRSRSRFHPELTFLGTALTGMYVTLEFLGGELNVRAAYEKSVGAPK